MGIKNKKFTIYLPLFLAVAIVGGMFLGINIQHNKLDKDHYFVYPKKNKLDEVLYYINNQYVDSVAMDKLTEAAIVAMLDSLDPHSVYIPSEVLKRYNEPLEGEFSGIGIKFNMQNDTVVVINTIANGPSEKVGIQPGDRIIEVNDSNVAGVDIPTNEIVSRLKGKKGTTVEVGVYRKGVNELIDFTITRDDIPLYSIDISYMLTDTTGYIKLSKFSKKTSREFIDALQKLKGEGMNSLILDLRGNGGGFLGAATDVVDHFLQNKELIVYTKGRNQPRRNVYASEQGLFEEGALIILIDEWSASASEIVAGAIQDNDRAMIVGRRSFGKGLVQQQMLLTDKSALRLTVARYYTPTGRCIQKPYGSNKNKYYNELTRRYEHGEFFEVDSIDFPDSLKYKTPEGDIVYGGGGIMPDLFVPQDTSEVTDYYAKVSSKGLIYKFAFQYTDNHREQLSAFKDPDKLSSYLDNKNFMKEFIEFAASKGISENRNQINESMKLLRTNIKAYIARNVMDNKGFYPIIKDIDGTLQKSLKVITRHKNF